MLSKVDHNAFWITGCNSPCEFARENFSCDEVISLDWPTLTVDKARELKQLLSLKSNTGLQCVCVVFLHITEEAQNALLKTVEELSANHKLLFFSESEVNILDTLKSRFFKVEINADTEFKIAEEFKKSQLPDRIKILEKMQKDENYREKANDLLDGLLNMERDLKKRNIILSAKASLTQSGFVKSQLEYVALMI